MGSIHLVHVLQAVGVIGLLVTIAVLATEYAQLKRAPVEAQGVGSSVTGTTSSPSFAPVLSPVAATRLPTAVLTPTLKPTLVTPNPTETATTTTSSPTKITTSNPTVTTVATPGVVQEGSLDGVAYYHCSAGATENVHHLVLLHGASFTKENWKNHGILDQFCAVPQLSVTPLDLAAYAGSEDLRNILDSLEASTDVQVSKPVVLVTPSASGFTIVDWIINGDVSLIPQYIETWVPIAAGSLTQATDEQVQSLGTLPILAIYGNGDSGGVQTSQRLADLVGAKAVELVGGHSVYLEQEDEFVDEVLSFLGLGNTTRRL